LQRDGSGRLPEPSDAFRRRGADHRFALSELSRRHAWYWPLTTYSHVADWHDEIRSEMLKCSMPPPDAGIAMPDEERERILMLVS
jgi:hypothetical protein